MTADTGREKGTGKHIALGIAAVVMTVHVHLEIVGVGVLNKANRGRVPPRKKGLAEKC